MCKSYLKGFQGTAGEFDDSQASGCGEGGGSLLETPDQAAILLVLVVGQSDKIHHSMH